MDSTVKSTALVLGGAVVGAFVFSKLAKTGITADYPVFKNTEDLANSCRASATAAVTAKKDGAKNREYLANDGLLGKRWPVSMRTKRSIGSAEKNNTKTIHFIRHGQGFHNMLADFSLHYGVSKQSGTGTLNPYHVNEVYDPPLTEVGRQQAMALQPTARKLTNVELVVVSPMCRALMTSNIGFAHLLSDKSMKWIAHEGCRERAHGNACDYRRLVSNAACDFPNVDFSLIPEKDPWLEVDQATGKRQDETAVQQAQRAYDFMLWLRDRPEREIVVSSHSAWLFACFNAVLQCEDQEMAEWFQTGEMRSVEVGFSAD